MLPYLVASLLGIGISLYGDWQKWQLNRLFLGIDLYFISGLIAVAVQWQLLNQFYAQQGAPAMLAWILIVGLWATHRKPIGMLGIPERRARKGFWYLLNCDKRHESI